MVRRVLSLTLKKSEIQDRWWQRIRGGHRTVEYVGFRRRDSGRGIQGDSGGLIVGHSNTCPTPSSLAPIAEDEFERIYTITLDPDRANVVECPY